MFFLNGIPFFHCLNRTGRRALRVLVAGATLGLLPQVTMAESMVTASDPEAGLEWVAGSDAGHLGEAVSAVIDNISGYDLAVVDMDADGTGEIILRAQGCSEGEACDFTIVRYDFASEKWVEDLSFTATDIPFVPIMKDEERHYGLRLSDVVWVPVSDGFMPAAPFVQELVESRDPYVDEVAFIEAQNPRMPPDQAWGRVYEIDLDGDGSLDRIIQVETMFLCMAGGSLCPFYAIDTNDHILAEGFTMDTPMVIDHEDGRRSLMAVGMNGIFLHHELAALR